VIVGRGDNVSFLVCIIDFRVVPCYELTSPDSIDVRCKHQDPTSYKQHNQTHERTYLHLQLDAWLLELQLLCRGKVISTFYVQGYASREVCPRTHLYAHDLRLL
jgi:hypothetical protein